MTIVDGAGAVATTALICAIALPDGSFLAQASWVIFGVAALVGAIGFVREHWLK